MFYDFLLAFLLGGNHKGRSFDRIVGIYVKIVRNKVLLTYVALVIVVRVNVRSYGRVIYMSAVGELVPVILFVTVKLFLGLVGVYAELILTAFAESVVILIRMSYLSRFGNGMSAGCGIPVVNSVVLGNFGIILVSAELSHTCRAVTVAVSVVVRKLSRLGKVVSAGDRMPVIILIGKPAI